MVLDLLHPSRVHWAGTRPRLSSHDHPIDAAEINPPQRTQQRLDPEKLHVCRCAPKVVNAENVVSVFHTDAHKDVRPPFERRTQLQQPLRPLCKQLVLVPASAPHHVKYPFDVADGHLFVEEITRGIYEDSAWALPFQRQFQHVRLQRETKAVGIASMSHRL